MATKWQDFGDGTYALIGGSNIGVIAHEGRAVMIDSGLDKSSVKKALRAIDQLGMTLEAVIITHGHADHFGGAGWLAEQMEMPVYAPGIEAAFVAHPLLEPLFLYGGAAPIAELRGKFTLAEHSAPDVQPLPVGRQEIAGLTLHVISLPGHAPAQVGIGYGDATLFCGDAVFPQATLDRHPILFCADLDAWLETLTRLPTLSYTRYVPGHGAPLTDNVAALAEQNIRRLREIRERTWAALTAPRTAHEVLHAVADAYDITFSAPEFFLLALTTIHAALTSLQRSGEAAILMEDNRMLWRRT